VLLIGSEFEAWCRLHPAAGLPGRETIAIQAGYSVAAAFEDAAVEYDLGVVGKHINSFFMQTLLHRLLEGLMKLAKRFFLFQQSCSQRRTIGRGGLFIGHAQGRCRCQSPRSAGADFPDEGSSEDILHAFLLFGPYKSTMSNLPM
jgi:hypothetical protein